MQKAARGIKSFKLTKLKDSVFYPSWVNSNSKWREAGLDRVMFEVA